jgi:GDP/UDP-N,N'-diacetylbacillosamine 2-epimerase (hydrolysing)
MRSILYITGTRADYGLMRHSLSMIDGSPELDLGLIVTGTHLNKKFGLTINEIKADKFDIVGLVETDVSDSSGLAMAKAIGKMVIAFSEILATERPDIVLLLGDRGEMLAGAVAAIHLNIPIAHIHGGERSGTVDEPVRHAISKLSHFHLVATDGARDRLIRMGEKPEHIHTIGAPGLDGIRSSATQSRAELMAELSLDAEKPVALMVFHPVLQDENGAAHARAIIEQLAAKSVQIVALAPNSDSGSETIRRLLDEAAEKDQIKLAKHFKREKFLSWMASADLMIGNSSAGIIEAASFGIPVVNVGSRQNLRERNLNVMDVETDAQSIAQGIDLALRVPKHGADNIYGDGNTAAKITDLLKSLALGRDVMDKCCVY